MVINFKAAVANALDKTTVDEEIAKQVQAIIDSHASANAKAVERNGGKPVAEIKHNATQIEFAVRGVLNNSDLMTLVNDCIVNEAVRAANAYADSLTTV